MKKEVSKKKLLIVITIIIIALVIIGFSVYFILRGIRKSIVPGGDYSLSDEEIDYGAGAGVGDSLAEGTKSNIFGGVQTNPFNENE